MSTIDISKFDTKLGIQYSDYASTILEKDYWIVKKQFTFQYKNITITVPKGYLTDGATVPRLFWSFIPPWGKYGQACVVHDFLCEHYKSLGIKESEINIVFYSAMTQSNVPKHTKILMTVATELYRILIGFNDDYSEKRSVEADLLESYNDSKIWS